MVRRGRSVDPTPASLDELYMRLLQRRERRTRLSLARSGQSGASGSRRARAVGLRTPGCLAMESTPPRFTIPPGARKEACRTISARPVGNDDAWRSRPSPGRTFFLRPVIHWLACRARNDFAMREGAKSALVAQLEPCRRIVIVVGRRMHAAACSMTPMTCSSSPGLTLKPSCARGGTAKAPALWSPTEKHSAKPGVRSPPDVIIMNASDAARAQTTLTRSSEGTAAGAPYDAAQKGSRDAAGPTLRGTGVSAGTQTIRHMVYRCPNSSTVPTGSTSRPLMRTFTFRASQQIAWDSPVVPVPFQLPAVCLESAVFARGTDSRCATRRLDDHIRAGEPTPCN